MTRTHNFFGLLAIAAFISSFTVGFSGGSTTSFILTFTLGICFTIVFLAMKAAIR
jgi:hypothetical protein